MENRVKLIKNVGPFFLFEKLQSKFQTQSKAL